MEIDEQPGNSLLLSYSNTILPERLSRSQESTLRAKHGLLPTQLDIANSWALQADSYHFEVSSISQDVYVYDHHLEMLESSRPLKQENFNPTTRQWYVRVYQEEARSIAHLYIRRQGRNSVPDYGTVGSPNSLPAARPGVDFKSVMQFREIPPGSLGTAATVALVTTLMVVYFAFFRVGIDPQSNASQADQDIPALLLTLPAFLAAAVGRGMSSERLLNSSLTAFYGLWVVVSTSLAAVLLYIYSANNRTLPLEVGPSFYGSELKFNLIWVALALFSIGTYLHLEKRKGEERKYYLDLLGGVAIDRQVK